VFADGEQPESGAPKIMLARCPLRASMSISIALVSRA
jgi:hypothetical protein